LRGGHVHVGDRLTLEHDPRRTAIPDEATDLLSERPRVREEERSLPAVHDDAGDLPRVAMCPEAVPFFGLSESTQYLALGPPCATKHEEHSQPDGDADARQDPECDDARGRDEREDQRTLAHAVVA